jgi:ATP-dependent DNA helicase RecG
LELVRRGQKPEVVFRSDTIRKDEFAYELVALLNLRGGRVILGVEDDGSITGITRDRLEEWMMTTCRDRLQG